MVLLIFVETTAVFSTKLAKGESSEDLNQRRKAEPEILCLLLGQGKICLQMINFVEVSSSKKVSFPRFFAAKNISRYHFILKKVWESICYAESCIWKSFFRSPKMLINDLCPTIKGDRMLDFLEEPSEVGGAGCYSPILHQGNSLCFQNTMTPSSTKEVVGVEHRGLESKGSKKTQWQFGGSFFAPKNMVVGRRSGFLLGFCHFSGAFPVKLRGGYTFNKS